MEIVVFWFIFHFLFLQIDSISALVRRIGDKPSSEPNMTKIFVVITRRHQAPMN